MFQIDFYDLVTDSRNLIIAVNVIEAKDKGMNFDPEVNKDHVRDLPVDTEDTILNVIIMQAIV